MMACRLTMIDPGVAPRAFAMTFAGSLAYVMAHMASWRPKIASGVRRVLSVRVCVLRPTFMAAQ